MPNWAGYSKQNRSEYTAIQTADSPHLQGQKIANPKIPAHHRFRRPLVEHADPAYRHRGRAGCHRCGYKPDIPARSQTSTESQGRAAFFTRSHSSRQCRSCSTDRPALGWPFSQRTELSTLRLRNCSEARKQIDYDRSRTRARWVRISRLNRRTALRIALVLLLLVGLLCLPKRCAGPFSDRATAQTLLSLGGWGYLAFIPACASATRRCAGDAVSVCGAAHLAI